MASDLLERMRRNPAGDLNIRDVETVCREYGVLFQPGKGTSHCHAKHPAARENIDYPGAAADQASLHSQARALY
jgi:hypothetical protein